MRTSRAGERSRAWSLCSASGQRGNETRWLREWNWKRLGLARRNADWSSHQKSLKSQVEGYDWRCSCCCCCQWRQLYDAVRCSTLAFQRQMMPQLICLCLRRFLVRYHFWVNGMVWLDRDPQNLSKAAATGWSAEEAFVLKMSQRSAWPTWACSLNPLDDLFYAPSSATGWAPPPQCRVRPAFRILSSRQKSNRASCPGWHHPKRHWPQVQALGL